ncbi:MAG TPA: PKD domain-containing protein [Chitinophagales bacterium]|nr:PKD domain-containing protein [Chitinophagales bacterium]
MKKSLRTFTITLTFALTFSVTFAQLKYPNTWYFSTSRGIDFNSGTAVLLTTSSMSEYEGCSAISSATTGHILMYTDGMSVWNANHTVMQNGSGLQSTYAAGQQGLIVPDPGDTNKYYLFTSGEYYSAGTDGYRYNIIDMTLDGGLGAVAVTKNVLLYSPASEKLCAIVTADGDGYWVATHEYYTNNFQIYKLTSSGLSLPVTSSVGTVFSGVNPDGCMKFSADGKRICLSLGGSNEAEVFDFNDTTGAVTNPITVGPVAQTWPYTYGVCMSPDATRLYVTEENDNNLYQYDLTAGNQAAINASKTVVGTTASYAMQTMQVAPDGKMYVARNGGAYLAVVNAPDSLGVACNFVDDGFYLNGGSSSYGLPNFPESFFSLIKVENTCFGDSTHFLISNAGGDSIVAWDFGDPASGAANADTGSNVYHVFTTTDTFQITIIEYLNGGTVDTTYLNVLISGMPVIELGNDTTVCIGDTLTLDAGNPGAGYSWSNGSNTQTIAVTDSATYSVVVSNGGCKNTDSVNVSFIDCSALPQPGVSVPDPTICEKFCLDFTDQSTNNPTAWLWIFDGGNPSTSTLQNPTQICYNLPGMYDVTLTASNAFGSLTQTFPNYITVYATPPAPVINQSGYTLFSSFATSYQWQFNSVDIPGAIYQSYTVTQSGYYTVVVTDSHGCINYTSVYVLISGVDDVGGDANVLITPNPSDGNFMVELLNGLMAEKIFVEVSNDLGQIIFSSEESRSIGTTHWKKQIDLSVVARGIYFVGIKTEHEFVRKKILIAD